MWYSDIGEKQAAEFSFSWKAICLLSLRKKAFLTLLTRPYGVFNVLLCTNHVCQYRGLLPCFCNPPIAIYKIQVQSTTLGEVSIKKTDVDRC